METVKRQIPLKKRIIFAGDVFNSLMVEKQWSATEAADFMKKFRMVDAVEVVRCKNCKHIAETPALSPLFCNHEFGLYGAVKEDYFCPYGERKEDEDT